MKIDRNNCEAFFLDHYEGTLTSAQEAELILFLENNPELKEQFYSFENISLLEFEENIEFKNKEELKRSPVTAENFDVTAIAYLEGVLNTEQENSFFAFLEKNPAYKVEFELYRKTILSANDKVIFADKDSLKKQAQEIVASERLSESESLLIGSVEGILDRSQQKQLELLLEQPSFKKELALYQSTKLTADPSIVFADKESLKRSERSRVPFFYYISAAASLALLFGFYMLFSSNELPDAGIASRKNKNEYKLNVIVKNTDNKQKDPVILVRKNDRKKSIVLPLTPFNDQPKDPKNEDNVIVKAPDTLQKIEVIVNNTPVKNNKDILYVNPYTEEEIIVNSNNGFMSLREVVALKVKDKLLNEEMQDATSYKEDKKKFSWYDAVLVLTKGVRKLTGREVEVKKKYDTNNELIAYQFTAGKYTYTKPVAKN